MCLLGYGCRLSLGRGGRRRNPRGQWLRQTPCDHELRPPRERKAGHPQRAWRFPYRFANDKYSQLMRHPNRIFLSPYPYLSAWGVRGEVGSACAAGASRQGWVARPPWGARDQRRRLKAEGFTPNCLLKAAVKWLSLVYPKSAATTVPGESPLEDPWHPASTR